MYLEWVGWQAAVYSGMFLVYKDCYHDSIRYGNLSVGYNALSDIQRVSK